MTRTGAWLVLMAAGAVLAGVVSVELRRRADTGRGLPAYSVFSREANGLAALAEVLRGLGWEPVAVTRPVENTRYRGLLILAEPAGSGVLAGAGSGLPENDARGLLRWVEQGNTLLYAGRHHVALHEALGLDLSADLEATADDLVRPAVLEAGAYTEDVRRVAVEGRNLLGSGTGLPLWTLDGRPGAVLLRRGRGHVIVLADPSPLTGRGLRREDNAVFLYNVARRHSRDGKVYFDEVHHGLESGSGLGGYLAQRGGLWLLAPLAVVLGAAGWAVGVRLGRAVPRPEPVRADAVDYAAAMARIYQQARVRRPLGRSLAREFLASLTRHLGLRRQALPAEILAAWRQRHPGRSGDQLQGLLRQLGPLRKGEISDGQLLAAAVALDGFLKDHVAAHGPAQRTAQRKSVKTPTGRNNK